MWLMNLKILLLSRSIFGNLFGHSNHFREKNIYYGFNFTDTHCLQHQASSFWECEMSCSMMPNCYLVSAFQEYLGGDIVCKICEEKRYIHTVNVQRVEQHSSGIIYHINPFLIYPTRDGIFNVLRPKDKNDKEESGKSGCEVNSGRLGIIKTISELSALINFLTYFDEKGVIVIDLVCSNGCTWGDGTRCQETQLAGYCPQEDSVIEKKESRKTPLYGIILKDSTFRSFSQVKRQDVGYYLCQYNPFGFEW